MVEIGYKSFTGCTALKGVFIPASMVEMDIWDIFCDWWAFEGCNSLARIDVHPDNPVFASEDGVLLNKEKTEIIKCPNGRQGGYLIPDSVIDIGRHPFSYIDGLTSLSVSQNHPKYSSIDGVLFNKDQTALERCPQGRQGDYVIPESVVAMHTPFEGCTALTSIFIPASVVEIGFVNEITLAFNPEEARRKEEYVFCSCGGLTAITVDQNNPLYASIDGVLFNKDKTELIVYPKGRQGGYVIPKSVVKIRGRAFRWCTGLTSVTIPESVTEIGEEAFYGCIGLVSIAIPDSVTKMGTSIFWDCTALTSITLPNTITEIAHCLFKGCTGLASIFIPASVKEIRTRSHVANVDDLLDFYKCPAFITVHRDNPIYTSKDGKMMFKKN